MNFIRRYLVGIVFLLVSLVTVPAAFTQPRFSVDGMLGIVDVQIADINDDGRWLVAQVFERKH